MSDFNATNLAGAYATVPVTIGASAVTLQSLVDSAIATLGYTKSKVLQMTILGSQSGVATARAAVLFGGSASQDGYLDVGVERTFPVRGDAVYVKRAGAPDVSAVIEVYLRQQL